MALKKKVIVLPRGKVNEICKAEGVGKTSVYAAMNYSSNSAEAMRLRKLAVSCYGGVESTKVVFTE